MRRQFVEWGIVRRWYNFPQLGKESVSLTPGPSPDVRGVTDHIFTHEIPVATGVAGPLDKW